MYKLIRYIVFSFLTAFALSGINFNNIIKKNKTIEVRILVIILSLSIGYLLTNFVLDFVNITRIS